MLNESGIVTGEARARRLIYHLEHSNDSGRSASIRSAAISIPSIMKGHLISQKDTVDRNTDDKLENHLSQQS
ncbi:MAG: hypothetical protein WA944_14605 [Mycobacterium sp.]